MPVKINPIHNDPRDLRYSRLRRSIYKNPTVYNELENEVAEISEDLEVPEIFAEEPPLLKAAPRDLSILKEEINNLIEEYESKLQNATHAKYTKDMQLEDCRLKMNKNLCKMDDCDIDALAEEMGIRSDADSKNWQKMRVVSTNQSNQQQGNRFIRVLSNVHGTEAMSRIVDTNHFFDYLSFTEPPEWYIWLPCSDTRIYWDVLVLSLVAYYGFAVPVMIAFPESDIPLGMEIVFILIFTLDIFMNFLTAYEIPSGKNQGWLETRTDLIAKRYLAFWFWLDTVSTIPFDMFFGEDGTWIRLTKIFRLLRICRAGRIFDRIFCYLRTHPSIVRLVRYLVYLAFVLHWLACGFWYIGGLNDYDNEWNLGIIEGEESNLADESLQFRYLNALLWSIWISTGTGNSMHPRRPIEAAFTCIGTLVGVLMYAFIVGSASSALCDIDTSSSEKSRRIQEIQQFLNNRGVDKHLSREIIAFYEYRWAQNVTTGDEDIFSSLHGTLKRTLRFALHKDIIRNVPMFKDVTEPIVEALISSCISRIYLPNEWVILRGERGKGMFFIYRGMFEVIPDIYHPPVAVLTDGQSFGEMAILTNARRNSSIRSVCHGELLFLSKSHFKDIFHRHPVFAITVEKWSPHCRRAKGWAKIRAAVRLMQKLGRIGLHQDFQSMMMDLNGAHEQNCEAFDSFVDGLGKGHLLRQSQDRGVFANKNISIKNRSVFFRFIVRKAVGTPSVDQTFC